MKKPVVLIVDDEPEARSTIAGFLKMRFNCDFKEVNDGEEALEFVKSNPCDVMFLDIKLPKMSGIMVIKHAKDINPKIDIIVVTGYSSDEVAEESLKLGATDYAVKPVDLKALELKFGNILKKRGHKVSKT
jgi:YesN/AraC family two-component response regulator